MSVTQFTAEEAKALEEKVAFIRMLCLPVGAIGLYFLANPWPADTWGWYAFWTLVTSYALFCWTSCFHECAHQTLTKWPWMSIVLGRLLGTAMFVAYNVYRESHIRHHAYLNKPTDWELWPYSDPHTSKTFRRIFVWFDLVFGFVMSPFIYGRLFFHKNSPLKNPALRRTIRNEYIVIALFWGTVIGLVTYYQVWPQFFKVWLVPHFLAGVYQSMRKFTEHLGMASYDPMLGTRTVLGPNWFTRIGCFMNFDIFIHGPHHRHPRVAHNQLGEKMNEYMQANPDAPFPLYKSYLRASAAAIPFFFTNPGVGMNAGATAPGRAKATDVQNFVGDVVNEVLADTDAWQGVEAGETLMMDS